MSDDTSMGLLKKAQDTSDRVAWDRLVSLYTPLLYGWLCQRGLQHQDAEDVVQEALVFLARELPNFQHNGQPGSFRAWLRAVLGNRLRDFQRAAKTRQRTRSDSEILERIADQLADPDSDLTKTWDREHDQYIVHRLLERIRGDFQPTTWRAFERMVLENANAAAVSSELGLSLESIYTAKSRVLRGLRQEQKEFPP